MDADQAMETEGSKLLHSDLTDKIIGVYYDVYNEVGHGFSESVLKTQTKESVFIRANPH